MALDTGTLERYMALAAEIPSRELRIVLETPGGPKPSPGELERFLECAVPLLERAGMALAIENHFDVPCRLLAELAAGYPSERVSFCIDTANSLRNFESAFDVLALLGGRAAYYHFKDLPGERHERRLHGGTERRSAPEIWTPGAWCAKCSSATPRRSCSSRTGCLPARAAKPAIAADREWLRQSLANLRALA